MVCKPEQGTPSYTSWELLHSAILRCQACPRLVEHRLQVSEQKRKRFRSEPYWGKPVTGFGDPEARLLLVGLAPGAHGANRTGRVFTGDSSGDWIFEALHRFGFASQPFSTSAGDGMVLHKVFISIACRCVPPQNRPSPEELDRCRPFLFSEIALLTQLQLIITFGRIALDSFWKSAPGGWAVKCEKPAFIHGKMVALPGGKSLLTSYHPSRQNTQTGRLTRDMWYEVFSAARNFLEGESLAAGWRWK